MDALLRKTSQDYINRTINQHRSAGVSAPRVLNECLLRNSAKRSCDFERRDGHVLFKRMWSQEIGPNDYLPKIQVSAKK